MIIKSIEVGSFGVNCYIVACDKTKECVIIDPGDEGEKIHQLLKQLDLTPAKIINTHGHLDHIGANEAIKNITKADILIHKDDAIMLTDSEKNHSSQIALFYNIKPVLSPPADVLLNDGDKIIVGDIEFIVLHTPGHSPGSICLKNENLIFTGDLVFNGSIGRTDFPESSPKKMVDSLKRILTLDDKLIIYPGHGPKTVLSHERNQLENWISELNNWNDRNRY